MSILRAFVMVFRSESVPFEPAMSRTGLPQWAAIAALRDQRAGHPLGLLNDAIYAIGNDPALYSNDFHDITVGDNQLIGIPVGFVAGTGWDGASGWGTPNVANLVADL